MHGHTWKIAITIFIRQMDKLGIGIDFKKLKTVVTDKIIVKFDHKVLNHVMPINPTAENIAKWIFEELDEDFRDTSKECFLSSVKVWENFPDCYVEYYGE
jgi:6-pyruvoyltetrahydropterin/6-carboxytetrahydropterin synthase